MKGEKLDNPPFYGYAIYKAVMRGRQGNVVQFSVLRPVALSTIRDSHGGFLMLGFNASGRSKEEPRKSKAEKLVK